VIERRIAQLRATDPEVARRIMELNQVEADTIIENDLTEQGRKLQSVPENKPIPTRGQQSYEEPAPIPERSQENSKKAHHKTLLIKGNEK